ncbi:hypothetical protein GDO86_016549, partial [Hymenochirus boettgeri]
MYLQSFISMPLYSWPYACRTLQAGAGSYFCDWLRGSQSQVRLLAKQRAKEMKEQTVSCPIVSFQPNWSKILLGEPITMTCHLASAVQEEQTHKWYKDGNLIKSGQSISFKAASLKDSGNYQCQTNNGQRSEPINLEVIGDHIVLQAPPSIYEGDPVPLRCHGSDVFNTGNIRFYKDKFVIKTSSKDPYFLIRNVDTNTTGTYRCSFGKKHYSEGTFISVK